MVARKDKPLSEMPIEQLEDMLASQPSRQRREEIVQEILERASGRRPSPSGTSYVARRRRIAFAVSLAIFLVGTALTVLMTFLMMHPSSSHQYDDNAIYEVKINGAKHVESGQSLNSGNDVVSGGMTGVLLIGSFLFAMIGLLGMLQNSWIEKHWPSKAAPVTTLGISEPSSKHGDNSA